mgnify:CR=1 FL=1
MSFFITHSISYLGKISRYEFVKIAFFAIHKLRLRRKYGKIVSLKEGAAKSSNTTDEATPPPSLRTVYFPTDNHEKISPQ